jgi:acetyl-CoA C-acetyltransferase
LEPDVDDVVIVSAVRTPFGKRGGVLAGQHSIDLLATTLVAALDRSGVDPALIGQVVGGCVGQVGMQAMNVTRQAWLTAGLPVSVPSTTVDSQCGSSQQAATLAFALVKSGMVDAAVACGVEIMSRVPLGANVPRDGSLGKAVTKSYWARHEYTTQFQAAELIAQKWGITRTDADELGVMSQTRAADAVARGAFERQVVPIEIHGETGAVRVTVDEGLRATTMDGLAALRTNVPDGVHTAGTSSQVSDGAAAVVLMSARKAAELGVQPLATIVDSCLVGSDPRLMLTGPISATQLLLSANGMSLADIDLVEINEAFASVVLAWQRELKADMERVNPNGGAIALGHPLGATGAGLLTKAVHAMVDGDLEHALVTMCCGGGLATGSLLRR